MRACGRVATGLARPRVCVPAAIEIELSEACHVAGKSPVVCAEAGAGGGGGSLVERGATCACFKLIFGVLVYTVSVVGYGSLYCPQDRGSVRLCRE